MTENTSETISTEELRGLEYRNVGPHRAGRVVAVAGHPTDRMTFYFGAVAGGVWKTTDGGTYWENISDGFFSTAAVGAIAVSESDPNVIYVGTGETTIRGDVSHGDGVYKSTDGGQTWTNVGLKDTRHIGKIRIHPTNPDVVYVAALGHAWGPNRERGVYRSKDGGTTWEQVLFRSERAGAIDLSMDPGNPRILYAAFWEAQRTHYGFYSGGPGSSLYKSTDGGDTWTEITRNDGLPKGPLGKVGVAVSPARPERVWALIEAEEGGLYRSDNGGVTWQRTSDDPELRRRAWYYMHLFADPRNPDVCWILNLDAWKSTDGGKTFTTMPTPHGDNHDLWIDPHDSDRLIEGNDGGACVSFTGGGAWSTILNQPTAQFYHVTADTQVPYRLYGSQQDNTAISVPSMSVHGAITTTEWFVPGGGESGYIAVRPDDPNIQYAGDHRGFITRHDRRTGQERVINVWPDPMGMYEGAESLKYRFQWTFPIAISPFDPHVLYTAGNMVFRSTDEGTTWEAISPDLTRADPATLKPAGGELTRDNTSAETYATIFAFVESPQTPGMFWAGADDGLVHLSRDGGSTWEEITPPDLKTPEGEWALISIIEPSPHDANTAYLAATRYKLDDTRPYLFKTSDAGKTWTKITTGIPDTEFTRVIREDPGCKGLLFAGTETGVYISFDDGDNWERFQSNLPICPIHDLIVHNGDLIIGTHGRSFWILDDISPLRQLVADRASQVRFFTPRDTIRFKIYEGFGGGEGSAVSYRMAGPVTYAFKTVDKLGGEKETKLLDAGTNPANGVIFTYYLPEEPADDITLSIKDAEGNEVQSFSSKKEKPEQEGETATTPEEQAPPSDIAQEEETEGSAELVEPEADEEEQEQTVPKKQGTNRFVWNFRYRNATKIPGDKRSRFTTVGPEVPPGRYEATLTVGGESLTQQFQIVKDPRIEASQEDLQAQFDLGMRLWNTIDRVDRAIIKLRDARDQLKGWEKRLKGRDGAEDAYKTAQDLIARLTTVEETFINTKGTGWAAYPPPNVPTRLLQRLGQLHGCIASADAVPTEAEYGVYEELNRLAEVELETLDGLFGTDIPAFNETLKRLEVPGVVIDE